MNLWKERQKNTHTHWQHYHGTWAVGQPCLSHGNSRVTYSVSKTLDKIECTSSSYAGKNGSLYAKWQDSLNFENGRIENHWVSVSQTNGWTGLLAGREGGKGDMSLLKYISINFFQQHIHQAMEDSSGSRRLDYARVTFFSASSSRSLTMKCHSVIIMEYQVECFTHIHFLWMRKMHSKIAMRGEQMNWECVDALWNTTPTTAKFA